MRTLILILLPFLSFGQLLQTQWSIGCGYNDRYPTDTNGACDKVNVNHQAVAMAQLINYYEFPSKGWGTETYTSNYGTLSTNYELPRDWNNISQLMLDCDIAVHSNYSIYMQAWQCGVITLSDINTALVTHFGYKSGQVVHSDLASLISLEIASNRPVIMELYPINFQCSRFVVVDGYNDGLFHFNFGVNQIGGWFELNNVWAMGTYWTLDQYALIGVEPDEMNVTINLLHDITSLLMPGSLTINGQYFNVPNGTIELIMPKGWYTINATTIIPWGNVNASDALCALKMFTGTPYPELSEYVADVTNDNIVNAVDAMMIAKRFVGQINSFPAGDWKHLPTIINSDTNVIVRLRCTGDIN